MNNTIIQINENEFNESLEPINNVFEEFEIFSSELFSQIMDSITTMLENFLK